MKKGAKNSRSGSIQNLDPVASPCRCTVLERNTNTIFEAMSEFVDASENGGNGSVMRLETTCKSYTRDRHDDASLPVTTTSLTASRTSCLPLDIALLEGFVRIFVTRKSTRDMENFMGRLTSGSLMDIDYIPSDESVFFSPPGLP